MAWWAWTQQKSDRAARSTTAITTATCLNKRTLRLQPRFKRWSRRWKILIRTTKLTSLSKESTNRLSRTWGSTKASWLIITWLLTNTGVTLSPKTLRRFTCTSRIKTTSNEATWMACSLRNETWRMRSTLTNSRFKKSTLRMKPSWTTWTLNSGTTTRNTKTITINCLLRSSSSEANWRKSTPDWAKLKHACVRTH